MKAPRTGHKIRALPEPTPIEVREGMRLFVDDVMRRLRNPRTPADGKARAACSSLAASLEFRLPSFDVLDQHIAHINQELAARLEVIQKKRKAIAR